MHRLLLLALAAALAVPTSAQVTSTFDEVRIDDALRVGDDNAAPTALVDVVGDSPLFRPQRPLLSLTQPGAFVGSGNRYDLTVGSLGVGVSANSLLLSARNQSGGFAVRTSPVDTRPAFLVRSDRLVGQLQAGTFGALAFADQWIAAGLSPFPPNGTNNPYGFRIQEDSDFAILQLVERSSSSSEQAAEPPGNKNAELAWGNETDDVLNVVFINDNNPANIQRTTVATFSVNGVNTSPAQSRELAGAAARTAGTFRVHGEIATDVLELQGGSDIAEPFRIADSPVLAPGMVVAIDPETPGALRVADAAYDRTVAGIVSGAGGIRPGLTLRQTDTIADGDHPVALTGRVYAHADARTAPIRPGDLLTTSDTPGHAMRATDADRASGAILGKAMTGLDEGTGLVLVLVSLQ